MHSANRAKQRQRQALEIAKQSGGSVANHNNNKVQIAFGSRAPSSGTPVTRRSKSLDRKSNSRKVQLIREQSAGKMIQICDHVHDQSSIASKYLPMLLDEYWHH